MKRFGLLAATLLSLLLTLWVLHRSAWFSRPIRTTAAEDADPGILSAAWDYHHRSCRHWRNCMLQR
jgi:hypothetical protein